MARSACGVSVSVSVELLLAGFGSIVPDGGATEAVFTKLPVAVALTVPASVRVMLWPVARLSPVHAPVPELYVPVLGVNTGLRIVAGTASVTVTLETVLGPRLLTVIV